MGWGLFPCPKAQDDWRDVSAPLPFAGTYAQRTDFIREGLPRRRWGNYDPVFNNQQGNPDLPTGRFLSVPLPGAQPGFLMQNAKRANPQPNYLYGGASAFAPGTALQAQMGSAQATVPMQTAPTYVSPVPSPWGSD